MPLPESPLSAKRAFLLLAVVATIFGGIVGYRAVSNEVSGIAVHQEDPLRHSSGPRIPPELVTRQSSPTKFHRVTNLLWAVSGFSLVVAVISFRCYRSLDDCL